MGDKPLVGFLGPRASYTGQATLSYFSPEEDFTFVPQTTIDDVFAAVQAGEVAYGVVPFENSSNGSVVYTFDLLANTDGRNPDVLVDGEYYLDVHHCLLGHSAPSRRPSSSHSGNYRSRRASTTTTSSYPNSPEGERRLDLPWRNLNKDDAILGTPGTTTTTHDAPLGDAKVKPLKDISHIKKLYSHPQAWGQCKLFLGAYLEGIKREDVSSTAKAAEIVAQDETGTSAAVSSKIAASINNLDVLADSIEDEEGNCTRFLVLKNRQNRAIPGEPLYVPAEDAIEAEHFKTMIIFSVSHRAPGALADCLAVFKKHDINLTSINSRPSGDVPWHYIFFVEFGGRKRARGGTVNDALKDLDKVAQGWKWLGSWENELKRK